MMDRPTLAGVICIILNDHRLGPITGKPWYMVPGRERLHGEQTYRCKCREWEGLHSDHSGHVAGIITERIAPLIEHRAASVAGDDKRDARMSDGDLDAKSPRNERSEG